MRTVRCCHGKPCEGSMPRSIQEFLIIMHLKLLHYYAFEKNFFVLYSPWPFDLCTFRNSSLSCCHPWLNHVKEYDRFLLRNLLTVSQSFFTITIFRSSRFRIYGPSCVKHMSIGTFSPVFTSLVQGAQKNRKSQLISMEET